jgi:polar amino acid transport system permease protein
VIAIAAVGLLFAVVGILLMLLAAQRLRHYNHDDAAATAVGAFFVIGSLYPLWPSLLSFVGARRRAALLGDGQLVASRRAAAAGREEARIAMGYAAAAMIVAGLLLLAFANDAGITQTFFKASAWHTSFHAMIHAFWTNIWASVAAQVIVLLFGLLLAILRMLPGRAGAPLRLIALVYCDIFRAIPAIVTILLIVFGVPLAIPATQTWNPVWLGILALALTYSAYVAEVYRAGLASIHPSQSAAARSLGLSYAQTLRTVLVPQAVRRVIPPLLNDFISLQKDTALLSTVGIAEVVQISGLYEASLFTLAPVVLAAAFFIIITVPQARGVDYLINRDARRRGQR